MTGDLLLTSFICQEAQARHKPTQPRIPQSCLMITGHLSNRIEVVNILKINGPFYSVQRQRWSCPRSPKNKPLQVNPTNGIYARPKIGVKVLELISHHNYATRVFLILKVRVKVRTMHAARGRVLPVQNAISEKGSEECKYYSIQGDYDSSI